jgi:hypothetical protein
MERFTPCNRKARATFVERDHRGDDQHNQCDALGGWQVILEGSDFGCEMCRRGIEIERRHCSFDTPQMPLDISSIGVGSGQSPAGDHGGQAEIVVQAIHDSGRYADLHEGLFMTPDFIPAGTLKIYSMRKIRAGTDTTQEDIEQSTKATFVFGLAANPQQANNAD